MICKALVVPGHPQILLTPEANPGWKKLNAAYAELRKEIEACEADLILYYSTQWLSVLGYTFQSDPNPEWVHVDQNFHDLGSMPYKFKCDPEFAKAYAAEVKADGHHTMMANYRGFPIDTGTIVAQKLLNPANRLPASMVSCNMYGEKAETVELGRAGLRALEKSGKKAIVVLVTALSNRYFVKEIAAKDDRISSAKDDEWNRKIIELLGEGRLEDTAQVARDFGREANGDMGFKGIWWLDGICGETNNFTGKTYGYEPVWGTGAALVSLTPTSTVKSARTSAAEVTSPAAGSRSETFSASKAPEPVGAYPHARREGEFLFLSGVGPRERGKKEIPGVQLDSAGEIQSYDVEVQTRSVINNVKTILEASGSSLEQVVDVQVFLTNMKADFPIFNKIYAEFFGTIQATRTTIEVGSLPTPIAVEFKVIAKI
jgi:2-aminophenol/2-amino-5-chlorophenol 1,6-dioxygenase alpha subunit